MSTKALGLQMSSQKLSKKQVVCTVDFWRINKLKVFFPAQTRDSQFPFAYHRKKVGNVDKKNIICQTLVERFQFLANCI